MRKSRENYRQIHGKSKASLQRNLRTVTAPKIVQDNPLLCSFSLQSIFFSEQPFCGNYIFDIRFSYKHVKMASKTVTRSILFFASLTDYKPVLLLQILSEQSEQILKIKLLSMLNKDNFLNHQDLKQADVNIKNQKIL